jgi:DNA-binding NarL/FixJ family response regulator
MTTVLIADDQALVRGGFRLILELAGLEVVGRPRTAPRRSSSPAASRPTSC